MPWGSRDPLQRPWDLPGWHRQERDLCLPGKGQAGWDGRQRRGHTDWVRPSTRKTSVAQPARNAKTPSGSGLTASQVSPGRAAGKGQRPPGGLWRPRPYTQPLPASLLAPQRCPGPLGTDFGSSHLQPWCMLFSEAPRGKPFLNPQAGPAASLAPTTPVILHHGSAFLKLCLLELCSGNAEGRDSVSLCVPPSVQLCAWRVQKWATWGWKLPVLCWIHGTPL